MIDPLGDTDRRHRVLLLGQFLCPYCHEPAQLAGSRDAVPPIDVPTGSMLHFVGPALFVHLLSRN